MKINDNVFRSFLVALAICVVSPGLAMDVNRVQVVLVNDYANNLNFTVQTAAGTETYANVLPKQSHLVGFLDEILLISAAGVSGWQGKTKTISQADLQGCWNRKDRQGRNTMRIPISKFFKSVPWAGIKLTWDCEAVNYEISVTKETEEQKTTTVKEIGKQTTVRLELPVDLRGTSARKILRLDGRATKAEALKKLRALSRLFHPDKFDQNKDELAKYGITTPEQAKNVMLKISEAMHFLNNE